MQTKCTCGIEVREHGPGVCLDALFAELVMEWHKEIIVEHISKREVPTWCIPRKSGEVIDVVNYQPSTNIGHAMAGVEIADRPMTLHWQVDHQWKCIINNDLWNNISVYAETAPLAITRALVLWAMEGKGK